MHDPFVTNGVSLQGVLINIGRYQTINGAASISQVSEMQALSTNNNNSYILFGIHYNIGVPSHCDLQGYSANVYFFFNSNS